jgi:hypothetical protein
MSAARCPLPAIRAPPVSVSYANQIRAALILTAPRSEAAGHVVEWPWAMGQHGLGVCSPSSLQLSPDKTPPLPHRPRQVCLEEGHQVSGDCLESCQV